MILRPGDLYKSVLFGRRKTFNAPDYGDVEAWFDPSDLSTFTVDATDQVLAYRDKSGNGHVASKVNNAPKIGVVTRNGHNALTFTSANSEWLEVDSLAPFFASPHTIFLVFKHNALADVVSPFAANGAASENIEVISITPRGRVTHHDTAGPVNLTGDGMTSPGEWHVMAIVFDAAAIYTYFDGVLIKTTADTPEAATTFSFGQEFDGGGAPSNFFEGDHGDFLFYRFAMSDEKVKEASRALKQRWNTVTIPIPYRYMQFIDCWFDVKRDNTLIYDLSDSVEYWGDRSSRNRDATQTVGFNKPIYFEQLNGKPTIRVLDDGFFLLPDDTFATGNSPYSFLFASANRGDGGGAAYFTSGNNSPGQSLFMRRDSSVDPSNNLNSGIYSGNLYQGLIDTQMHVIGSFYDPAQGGRHHWIDGVSAGPRDGLLTRNGGAANHQLFQDHPDSNVDISEFIAFNIELPDADKLLISNYLTANL